VGTASAHTPTATAPSGTAHGWKETLLSPSFRLQFFLTVPMLGILLLFYAHFLHWIEFRPGVVLDDTLLASFPPRKVTWMVFALVYGGLVLGVGTLSLCPTSLLLALQSYAVIVAVRMAALYFVPLDPPLGMIPLKDPFVALFTTSPVLTKDLFFSGHTATLFLLYLTAQHRLLRPVFLLATLLVGAGVIWQHVHYTIDVLAAPFIVFGCYRFVLMLHRDLKVA
jgi:hypothetical protein